MPTREHFSTRLGFLLISAGCAIGLGNVWRFPFITGQYGGAIFVLIYLFFLVFFGVPLLAMEFSIGRASRRSLAQSFEALEKKGTHWHLNKYWMILGDYVLLSFYSVVTGWMLFYCIKGFTGEFGVNTSAEEAGAAFGALLASPADMLVNMIAVTAVSFGICACGLRKGVERITKPMMIILFLLLIFMALRSFTLPGFKEGMAYYLYPNLDNLTSHGLLEVISAAMAQAFFSLSIGVGAMQIFATYMDSDHTLLSESFSIMVLKLYLKFIGSERKIGIATPYKADAEILKAIAKDTLSLKERKRAIIDTVHAFQGKEVDIMILTLPDSLPLQTLSPLINRYDYGQNRKSESDRLLNVAISRARIKFILVSNESFLSIHSKPGSSLSALLDSTKTDEKGRKKRLKLLINTINEHLNEITELSLFGKKGDRIKLTSSSKTAWEMRREFWDSNDIAELYVSSTFFKTSLVPTLIRNIGKNKEKEISIHYGKRFKINREKS